MFALPKYIILISITLVWGIFLANFDITKHFLVPKHLILTKDEEEIILKKYNVTKDELPKIKSSDPAIAQYKPKLGDVVKIERRSVYGDSVDYYRVVA